MLKTKALIFAFVLLSLPVLAQDTPGDAKPPQNGGPMERGRRGPHGPGTGGSITAINGDSLTIKTFDGQTSQVKLSDKTQFRKDRQPASVSDFKVGDMVFVRGEQKDGVWQAELVATRSDAGGPGGGGMRGNFREELGKRFIIGEVKAINGTQLTIQRPDGVSQTIAVDENTSFKKDNESITLADFKVGDHVFGRGEMKNEVFVPSTLNVGEPRFMRGGPMGAGQQGPNQ